MTIYIYIQCIYILGYLYSPNVRCLMSIRCLMSVTHILFKWQKYLFEAEKRKKKKGKLAS